MKPLLLLLSAGACAALFIGAGRTDGTQSAGSDAASAPPSAAASADAFVWPAAGETVQRHAQRGPSARLGSVSVASSTLRPVAGEVFTVSFQVMPKEASAEGNIQVVLGPDLEVVAGSTSEEVALTPGRAIRRSLTLRKTQDSDTSVVVSVQGASARRGGAWSFSGHQNFLMSEEARVPVPTFVGAKGQPLVGDR